MLPLLGLLAGGLAVAPLYTGARLVLERRLELADHLVPGTVVVVAALAALAVRRVDASVWTGRVVAVAGVWMVGAHVPLVSMAARGEVAWGTTALHGVPGLAVLALGLAWILLAPDAAGRGDGGDRTRPGSLS